MAGSMDSIAKLSLMIVLLAASRCGQPEVAVRGGQVLDCQKTIDLGRIQTKTAAEAILAIRNPTAQAIEVTRVEVSCPCLKVSLDHRSIPTKGTATLTVRFDAAAEPDFKGRLGIVVQGIGEDATPLFVVNVSVEVE